MNFEINTETKTITLLEKVSITRMKKFLFEDIKVLLNGEEDDWTLEYKPNIITIKETRDNWYPCIPPLTPLFQPLPFNPMIPSPYIISCNNSKVHGATRFKFEAIQ